MKRKDLKIGCQYATSTGARYEVVDVNPVKAVDENGRFIDAPHFEMRFVAGKGHVPYQTNPCIAAYLIREDGSREPQAIEPRILTDPWEDYEDKRKVRRKDYAAQQRKARELTAAAKKAGLPRMVVDMEAGQAHIDVRALARHLGVKV